MNVKPEQRFTRSRPCPCCGCHGGAPRGQSVRCVGFISEDGEYCHCTREECAGGLEMKLSSLGLPEYVHRLVGSCRCGTDHKPGRAVVSVEGLRGKPRHGRAGESEPLGMIDRYYVYTDEHGAPRHRTVRFRDPKSFRQQRYECGLWRWGLGSIEPFLYGLPQLLQSPLSAPVVLAEGEKDAETLWAVGLTATTYVNGAWKQRYNQWLAERHIVVLQDNDDAGVLRSRRLRRQLKSVGASFRVITFPGLPVGGDVTDWLAAGGTVSRLKDAVIPPYQELLHA